MSRYLHRRFNLPLTFRPATRMLSYTGSTYKLIGENPP
jgi:hypothetical protein